MIRFLAAGMLAASLVGCAVDAEGQNETTSSAALDRSVVESFKLYGRPGFVPSATCDVHTELSLSNVAILREVVAGVCEIAVEPNERSYRLELAGTDCGSVIYRGSKRVSGKLTSITVTDHRGRTCRDVRDADIVVEESGVTEGAVQRLFSFDAE